MNEYKKANQLDITDERDRFLLDYAVMGDDEKINKVVQKVKAGKKLIAYYPGVIEDGKPYDKSKYDEVGGIIDGVLIIEK